MKHKLITAAFFFAAGTLLSVADESKITVDSTTTPQKITDAFSGTVEISGNFGSAESPMTGTDQNGLLDFGGSSTTISQFKAENVNIYSSAATDKWRPVFNGALAKISSANFSISDASVKNVNVSQTGSTAGLYGFFNISGSAAGTISNSVFDGNTGTHNRQTQGIVDVSTTGNVTFDNVTFTNNKSETKFAEPHVAGAMGNGGAIYLFHQNGVEDGVATIKNSTFANNSVVHDGPGLYAGGGAISIRNFNANIENTTFVGNSAKGGAYGGDYPDVNLSVGGAVYVEAAEKKTLNVTLKDVSFSDNSATWGGAIYLNQRTLVDYSVSDGKNIKNTGNEAAAGGFLYLDASSSAKFDVGANATLTIGTGTTETDSIVSGDTSAAITKTGAGTMTVDAAMTDFSGKLVVSAGTLNANLGLGAQEITVDSGAVLGLKISQNGMLSNANVSVTNNGTINLVAGANLANGEYSVIGTGTTALVGNVVAFGGKYENGKFTVSTASSVILDKAGDAVTVSDSGRIAIAKENAAATAPAEIEIAFNAQSVTVSGANTKTTDFATYIAENHADLTAQAAYELNISGMSENESAMVSIYIGKDDLSAADFKIFHKADETAAVAEGDAAAAGLAAGWIEADVKNVSYDGKYLTFEANHFSTYGAATAAPEPSAFGLLAGIAALAFCASRRRRSRK